MPRVATNHGDDEQREYRRAQGLDFQRTHRPYSPRDWNKLMRIKAVVLKRHHCSPQRFSPIDGARKVDSTQALKNLPEFKYHA
jgi:hypothetical protein